MNLLFLNKTVYHKAISNSFPYTLYEYKCIEFRRMGHIHVCCYGNDIEKFDRTVTPMLM